MLSVIMLIVAFSYCHAECHYSECSYGDCRGAVESTCGRQTQNTINIFTRYSYLKKQQKPNTQSPVKFCFKNTNNSYTTHDFGRMPSCFSGRLAHQALKGAFTLANWAANMPNDYGQWCRII